MSIDGSSMPDPIENLNPAAGCQAVPGPLRPSIHTLLDTVLALSEKVAEMPLCPEQIELVYHVREAARELSRLLRGSGYDQAARGAPREPAAPAKARGPKGALIRAHPRPCSRDGRSEARPCAGRKRDGASVPRPAVGAINSNASISSSSTARRRVSAASSRAIRLSMTSLSARPPEEHDPAADKKDIYGTTPRDGGEAP